MRKKVFKEKKEWSLSKLMMMTKSTMSSCNHTKT